MLFGTKNTPKVIFYFFGGGNRFRDPRRKGSARASTLEKQQTISKIKIFRDLAKFSSWYKMEYEHFLLCQLNFNQIFASLVIVWSINKDVVLWCVRTHCGISYSVLVFCVRASSLVVARETAFPRHGARYCNVPSYVTAPQEVEVRESRMEWAP